MHRAQLDRLLGLAGLDTVELAVLAQAAELPKATSHSFEIFDDHPVVVETITAELGIRDPDDTGLCTRLLELYWGDRRPR